MSTTAQDIFYDVRTLLDEYSDEGIVTPDADVADLQAKSIRLIDMAQKELYKSGKLFKEFEVTRQPYENELSGGFDLVEYTGTADYYPEAGVVALAYYFEVDGEGSVVIQEYQAGAWADLITVTVPNTVTTMTAYKGLITPTTTGNLIRIKFAGSYYYKHQNRALFNLPFSASRIPDYRPWVKYEMPSDFRVRDAVVNELATEQYMGAQAYKWEGFKDMYVSYDYAGTIRVVYKPVPATVTAISQTLEVDDITAKAIAYYTAARLAPFENPSLVNFFEQKYDDLKRELMTNEPASESDVVDLYGWG